MKVDQFVSLTPLVGGNKSLRIPQREAFVAIAQHFQSTEADREISAVLPVGCGKSGLLALIPFAVKARRALLVAPNLEIADQLLKSLRPSQPGYFYKQRGVLVSPPFPEPAEIRGTTGNMSDFDAADIVITNIQQLQGSANRWLNRFRNDYFDVILFDEGHHGVAESWDILRSKFPDAKVVSVSATPVRADGQRMPGEIIYNYPIIEAVRQGYVKSISGVRLNPSTLSYVRHEDGVEVQVSLDEVRKLGEEDAEFRRSIVSSEHSLETIVDASIAELYARREAADDSRLKIIASALNMQHCQQVVAKYTEKGLRANFVHSRLDSKTNQRVRAKLDNHELDVIVQVRKLSEGFDHPYLSVAAVFSIFANLSPFMQFIGRIMRVIPDKGADDQANHGVVVFHVGANVTGVWTDFQEFAKADQEILGKLVDATIDPRRSSERLDVLARPERVLPTVTSQGDITLEDIELLSRDDEVMRALRLLADSGITPEKYGRLLERIPPDRQQTRRAKRTELHNRISIKAGEILARRSVPRVGRKLDKTRDNFEVVVAALHKACNECVGRAVGARDEFSLEDYAAIDGAFDQISFDVEDTIFNDQT